MFIRSEVVAHRICMAKAGCTKRLWKNASVKIVIDQFGRINGSVKVLGYLWGIQLNKIFSKYCSQHMVLNNNYMSYLRELRDNTLQSHQRHWRGMPIILLRGGHFPSHRSRLSIWGAIFVKVSISSAAGEMLSKISLVSAPAHPPLARPGEKR